MTYSPIIIFGFDRPNHLQNMVTSLINNSESKDSDIFFFIDGPTEKTNLNFMKRLLTMQIKNFHLKINIQLLEKKILPVK